MAREGEMMAARLERCEGGVAYLQEVAKTLAQAPPPADEVGRVEARLQQLELAGDAGRAIRAELAEELRDEISR